MTFMNYVELLEDKPVTMHFTDWSDVTREIMDPVFNRLKPVEGISLWVDLLDGQPSARTLNIISQKLIKQLTPYRAHDKYANYLFTITKRGSGWRTDFDVDVVPYSP